MVLQPNRIKQTFKCPTRTDKTSQSGKRAKWNERADAVVWIMNIRGRELRKKKIRHSLQ